MGQAFHSAYGRVHNRPGCRPLPKGRRRNREAGRLLGPSPNPSRNKLQRVGARTSSDRVLYQTMETIFVVRIREEVHPEGGPRRTVIPTHSQRYGQRRPSISPTEMVPKATRVSLRSMASTRPDSLRRRLYKSNVQGNPEYAKLTKEVETPDWEEVSAESISRHAALQPRANSQEQRKTKEKPPTAPTTELTTPGGVALKEGGEISEDIPPTDASKIPQASPDPATRKVIAAVETNQEPAVHRATDPPMADLSVQETLDLLAALEARLPVDERPAALEQLGIQLRKGRQIQITTLEEILLRLREQGLGRTRVCVLTLTWC